MQTEFARQYFSYNKKLNANDDAHARSRDAHGYARQ
jgi:hypothetical protein